MRVAQIALFAYNNSLRVLYEYVRSDCIITYFNKEAVVEVFTVAVGIRSIIDYRDRGKVVNEVIRSLVLLD